MPTKTENLIDRVITYLKANLPTKLAAAGTPEPNITTGYRYGLPSLRVGTEMPLIAVRVASESGGQVTLGAASQGRVRWIVPIQIFYLVTDQDEEQALRYAHEAGDLIAEVIENDLTLNDLCLTSQVLSITTDDTPVEFDNVMLRASMVTMEAQIRRTRGAA